MDNLNGGSIQLGLVALAVAGLQIWWIGSIVRRRNLARSMRAIEFRKSLEKLWAKTGGTG